MKKNNKIESVLEPFKVSARVFDSYDPVNIAEIPLLFQTGYLTIKEIDESEIRPQYVLGMPNEEVRESFLEYLLHAYSDYPLAEIQELVTNMHKQLRSGDTSGLNKNLSMLLAHIPNILHVPKEAYYHSLFLLLMKLLGFNIQGELLTNVGRIDAVLHQPGFVVIAEIKYHAKKTLDRLLKEAMKQIVDNKYGEMYHDRKVMLMAVAFSGKEVKCELRNASST
jgi:hypothetical protein